MRGVAVLSNNNEIYSYTEKGKRREKRQQKRDRMKRKNKRPLWKTILLCLLSVILLFSGCGMIYYYNLIDNFKYKPIDDQSAKKKEDGHFVD